MDFAKSLKLNPVPDALLGNDGNPVYDAVRYQLLKNLEIKTSK